MYNASITLLYFLARFVEVILARIESQNLDYQLE